MNKNKEDIFLYIGIIIILVIFAIVIYLMFSSNKSLNSNTSPTSTAPSPTTNTVQEDEDITIYETPKIINEEIASFSTNIYDKDENRSYNIALAIEKINDKILNTDEVFSFNETVGPMDETHGFKDAVGFDSYGNKIQVPGGGMCQISSTIYNAVLIANLEVVERHPHSRRVYYVPQDKDATIYYNTLDFKFKNTSGNKLKIQATSTESNVTIKLIKIKE